MSETTTCAVIGGGPAGIMAGLLLARAGVRVTVLEKHGDFLRDFRGDTVHPTTMDLLDELGLSDRFAALPHSRIERVPFPTGDGRRTVVVDFRRLRHAHPYIAMVPQWDLLSLLADVARKERTFTLRMNTEATGLVRENGRVVGVRYEGPDGPGELRADLTLACDGRESVLRRESGLPAREFPVLFDAWWFRLPTDQPLEAALMPRVGPGKALIPIPREGYVQVAYLGPKGTDAQLRARGIEAFRHDLVAVAPEFADSVPELRSMDQVKHLDVRLNRLLRWHTTGMLCIGDAAHAMSPAGGVGINLAIQDAVAAARLLAGPLLGGTLTNRDLASVQRRRQLPTVVTQRLQRVVHQRVLNPILAGRVVGPPTPYLTLVERFPQVSVLPAQLVGVGVRPEHAPRFARR